MPTEISSERMFYSALGEDTLVPRSNIGRTL